MKRGHCRLLNVHCLLEVHGPSCEGIVLYGTSGVVERANYFLMVCFVHDFQFFGAAKDQRSAVIHLRSAVVSGQWSVVNS